MADKLSDARDDIQGQLDQLKSQVDTLLGNDFKTQHASGKFGEGYAELTTGLKGAVDGINDMAESLRGMMQRDPGPRPAARRTAEPAREAGGIASVPPHTLPVATPAGP